MATATTTAVREIEVRYNGKCRCGTKRSELHRIDRMRTIRRDWRGIEHVEITERDRTLGELRFHRVSKVLSVECECGRRSAIERVRHVARSDGGHECGPRCMGATGPHCECKCGGLNHGRANA